MAQPELSVVIPMYNVKDYLPECLASLAAQKLGDLEVIVVDDGSTDGSRTIADQWAAGDSRFRVLPQANGGVGAARNNGIRVARGRYLAFCDSDDVVPETAYAALVESLEATGSDFAVGDVRRLDSTGVQPYPGFDGAFDLHRRRTHILRHRALVRDRMVWNKVFRRSFWDGHDFAFSLPDYEDAAAMIRAHIAAGAVDVLTEIVYLWRIREQGPPSVTQQYLQPKNFTDWMRMMFDTNNVIRSMAPELVPAFAEDMCRRDIPEAMRVLHSHDAATLDEAMTFARSFAETVPGDVLDSLPAQDRRLTVLLARGELDGIRQLVEPF